LLVVDFLAKVTLKVLKVIIMSIPPELLFPTPVWILETDASFLDSLPRIVNKVQADYDKGSINSHHNKSNRLGGQSLRYKLFDNPYLSAQDCLSLRQTIGKVVNLPREDVFQTWLNCGYASSYNIPHIHSAAVISGVLYLKVPDGSGVFRFKDPRPQASYAALHNSSFLEDHWFLRPSVKIMPVVGQMLLFPSWFEHYVEPGSNQSELRISLAFNITNLLPK
jgi:uncharacterized protein (TIGR02466 family)